LGNTLSGANAGMEDRDMEGKEYHYTYGIISFAGYIITLLVFVMNHWNITMQLQLFLLLGWLVIDLGICIGCRLFRY
jgi:hypothetical protein